MKVFVLSTVNNTFNHYLISEDKLTVFTFAESSEEEENTDINVADFLSVHGEPIKPESNLPKGIAGENLKSGLSGLFDCVGRQTLDLSTTPATNSSLALLGEGERTDHATWVFMYDTNKYLPPFNRFAETSVTKEGTARMTSLRGHFSAQLCVPFENSLITDDSNSLLLKPGILGFSISGHAGEIIPITMEELRSHTGGWNPFPTLNLTGMDTCGSDGTEITIRLEDSEGELIERNCTVYLKSNSGYLSRTKVVLANGIGSTKFIPLGLDSGDVSTVKCGFKNFSNVVAKDITYAV